MKGSLVSVLCGLWVLVATAAVQADEVDDLLAGKPVAIPQSDLSSDPFAAPSLQERTVSPTLGAEWHATIEQAPAPASRPVAGSTQPSREAVPAAGVNLVPEPSAIALGLAAILYFLVFFRRRHLP